MKLFINYRRDDTDDLAGRLHDRLISEFGSDNVFKDVDSIRPGQNWKVVLEQAVAGCDVVLTLIGKHWVSCVDANGQRRLSNAEDWVRFELEAARRSRRLIMPVMVKGARVPRGDDLPESLRWLPEIHVIEIRGDPFFKDDVTRLVADLRRVSERLDEQARLAQRTPIGPATGGDSGGGAITCPACKRLCPRSDQFCESCGVGLWAVCPKCDVPVPAGQRFCKSCGADIPRVRQANEACEAAQAKLNELGPAVGHAERLSRLETLLHEVEPVVRLAPDHAALAQVFGEARKLACDAARRAAQDEMAANHLSQAASYYQRLAALGDTTTESSSQIETIQRQREQRLTEATTLMGQGSYKQAATILTTLHTAFPDDARIKEAHDECQQILQRAGRLTGTVIRDLRAQRRLIELERELCWLQSHRVRVEGLSKLLDDVRKKISAANSIVAEATVELRAGKVRKAEQLARQALQQVADHDGALQITRSSGGVAERLTHLDELVQHKQWCSAYAIVRGLEQEHVSDPRLEKLGARTKAVMATIDTYVLIFLAVLAVVIAAGVYGVPFLARTASAPTGWGSGFFYLVWATGALLLLSVTMWAFDHRSQVLRRLTTPFRAIFGLLGRIGESIVGAMQSKSADPDLPLALAVDSEPADPVQTATAATLADLPPALPIDAGPSAPGHGGMIQIFGIISVVAAILGFFTSLIFAFVLPIASLLSLALIVIGLVLGIIAWLIGRRDLRKIRTGEISFSAKSPTRRGFVCGIIGTALSGAFLLFNCIVTGLALAAIVRSAMG